MPRPAFEPTAEERALVQTTAGLGLPHDQIVLLVTRPAPRTGEPKPISEPTLRKHFRRELDTGKASANSKVAGALYATAIDRKHKGHVAAAIFWMKAQGGWNERLKVDHAGQVGLELDLSGATIEELAVLEKFLRRKADAGAPPAANAA